MNAVHRIVGNILLLIPALLLGFFAAAHFADGLATDAAVPIPTYMIAGIAMPKIAYQDAYLSLANVDTRDGEAIIARAEGGLHCGIDRNELIALLIQGLLHAPASARGWTLLSETLLPVNEQKAAQALSQALVLAPHEYWLVGARSYDAALLWKQLDADSQENALEQTRLLWLEPALHGQLSRLLLTHEGVSIVTMAFANQPDELREMNRWLSKERTRTSN